jgi:hypothetical protein
MADCHTSTCRCGCSVAGSVQYHHVCHQPQPGPCLERTHLHVQRTACL